MKKFVLILTIVFSTTVFAQEAEKKGPPAGNAAIGNVYGSKISAKVEEAAISPKKLDKKLKSIQLDPMRETADIDTSNNFWGEIPEPASKFEVFKQKNGETVRGAAQGKVNPMQAAGKK